MEVPHVRNASNAKERYDSDSCPRHTHDAASRQPYPIRDREGEWRGRTKEFVRRPSDARRIGRPQKVGGEDGDGMDGVLSSKRHAGAAGRLVARGSGRPRSVNGARDGIQLRGL